MLYVPRVALALVTLIIGLWVIRMVVKLTQKGLTKSKADPTLVPFFNNLLSWGLKALLLISVASMVGIATTPFVAVLGAFEALTFGIGTSEVEHVLATQC